MSEDEGAARGRTRCRTEVYAQVPHETRKFRKGHSSPRLVHSLLHLAESSFHNDAVGAQLRFGWWSAGVYKKSTAGFNCPQNAESD